MTRVAITAPGAATVGPYSHAVEGAGLLFLSGQTPVDPATGELVTGSLGEQTAQCFRNLNAVLEAAGLTLDDVVNVQVYLTDMNDFAAMNAVYSQQFGKPFPARTTIGVASLPLGASIEIGMTARTDRGTDSPYVI
ncbi:MAG: Rid family detoxifying hydrolase [Steroidobacteraceae bacterium]